LWNPDSAVSLTLLRRLFKLQDQFGVDKGKNIYSSVLTETIDSTSHSNIMTNLK
jgi:hypothetical protein